MIFDSLQGFGIELNLNFPLMKCVAFDPNKSKKFFFVLGQVTKASKNWGPDRHGERGQDWC